MKSGLSVLYIIIAGCFWGSMGLLVRPLNKIGITTMEIVALRSCETFLIMAVISLIFNRKAFRIKIKDIWIFAGTGILSVVFFNFCYFKTITLTSLSVAAVLLYTAPFFVMVLSGFFFKERISWIKIAAMILAFVGCACVTGMINGQMNLTLGGIGFGLLSGFGYALYSIFGRAAINKGYSSDTITLYTFLMASVGVLPFIKISHVIQSFSNQRLMISYTVVMVFVVTVIPYLTYTKGLIGMESGRAAVIASVEPVAATIIGMIVFKERPALLTIIGIILVLLSITWINLGEKHTE